MADIRVVVEVPSVDVPVLDDPVLLLENGSVRTQDASSVAHLHFEV